MFVKNSILNLNSDHLCLLNYVNLMIFFDIGLEKKKKMCKSHESPKKKQKKSVLSSLVFVKSKLETNFNFFHFTNVSRNFQFA